MNQLGSRRTLPEDPVIAELRGCAVVTAALIGIAPLASQHDGTAR